MSIGITGWDAGLIGAIVIMGTGAIEAVKTLATKVTSKRNGGLGSGVYSQHAETERLKRVEATAKSAEDASKGAYRILSATDGRGDPRVYFPRAEMEKQTALLEKMSEALTVMVNRPCMVQTDASQHDRVGGS